MFFLQVMILKSILIDRDGWIIYCIIATSGNIRIMDRGQETEKMKFLHADSSLCDIFIMKILYAKYFILNLKILKTLPMWFLFPV